MWRARTDVWYLERMVWLIAGVVVTGSITLGLLVSPYWFILPLLAGANMIIFSLSGFCPMAILLHKFGVRSLAEQDGHGTS